MKKVAVVILNWNGEEMLKTYLPSVVKHTDKKIADIVVADNGSTDHSLELLQNEFPEVKVIVLDKNYGFADGYNKSLSQCNATYFVLLNSDVEVTPNWLNFLIDEMDKDLEVAAAQPKIKAFQKKNMFEYAGAAGGYLDKYGFPFCRGRIISSIEEDKGQYNDPVSVMWATGACLMVRAKVYKEAGGLDGRFFAHMEEIDLCWRIKTLGYKIMAYPQSTVFHLGGGTLSMNSPRKLFLNYRNNLLLLYKNLPAKKLRLTLFKRMLLDGLSAIIFLAQLKFQSAWQVYMAHKEFRSMKKLYIARRKELHEQCVVTSFPEIFEKSIVYQFFVKGKKRFTDLKW